MKYLILITAILFSSFGFANEIKYGVFDYGQIIDQTDSGKQAFANMKKEKEKLEAEIKKMEMELEKKYIQFQKKKVVLNDKAIIKQEYELQGEAAHLEVKRRNLAQAFTEKQIKSSDVLKQELYIIVKRYAEKNNLSQVYEKTVAPFYLKGKQDITEDIIELMNKN